jgi:hypothetical protein
MNENASARISLVPGKRDRVWYRNAIGYWTEILDAEMPMPAASALMPMPSYVDNVVIILKFIVKWNICKLPLLILEFIPPKP